MYKIRLGSLILFIFFILYTFLLCYYESIVNSFRSPKIIIEYDEKPDKSFDCPDIPPGLLGRRRVISSPVPKLDELEYELLWVNFGGHYSPPCRPKENTAIIIPFRDREDQLLLFLKNMHPFLRRQQIQYTIFVVEQIDNFPFNRGELFNIGYVEAMKMNNFTCLFLHDVDLFPEDDRNLYRCNEIPKHMITGMNKWDYKLIYYEYFGGVLGIKNEAFQKVNGFSNRYWGWGGEDDDFLDRLKNKSIQWFRPQEEIGMYYMLQHAQETPNPDRFLIRNETLKYVEIDGLVNMKYRLIKTERYFLYTKIAVELFRDE